MGRRVVLCRFAYLHVYVICAAVFVYGACVLLIEIAVRQYIGKPNTDRLRKVGGVKQNEVICGELFHADLRGS